ncbi:fibrous sheath CABYR-binding protein-like isoform X1 [Heteronotia binoei]|uniref:fibrous sheath CABYR-binding protein-like isoform X1 n=1 Tax=Heteronotia binoei TaxID=13085 RepID=UPI00292D4828|nr:fibrous sheath CABYR-binding protein-like isoform X1 [Heteronotia binoei]
MMHPGKPRMVVPYGLKTLLEGVSRAVLKTSPSNITEFAALYFRELMMFREDHPNLDIKDLVREFHLSRVEGWAEAAGTAAGRGPPKRSDIGDGTAPMCTEPKRKEKSTDTEEDQICEEPARELSTKTTQYPSNHDAVIDKAGDEKARELAYVPADPAQLAAQMLGNECVAYEPELKDVAISVQTLPKLSQSTADVTAAPAEAAEAAEEEAPAPEAAPVEAEPAETEPAEAAPAEAEPAEAEPAEAEPAEVAPAASAQSVRAEPDTRSQTSVLGEVVTSGSQAELPPPDDVVEEASSDPLQEEPPPPAPPPPPDKDPLQAESCPSEIEVTSDLQLTPMGVEDPDAGGEAPPYIEQFPQQIVIPFIDNVACLLDPLTASLNAGQFTCTSILDPSADDAECDYDRMDTTEQLRPTDPGFIMSALATSEPGQPPPYSNVWTLYCLTDLKQQGRKSPPPPLPSMGSGAPVPQATLFLSSGKDQPQYLQPQMIQQGQPPKASSPTYVMMEDGKKGNAPPFILVGSSVQNKQDWKPIPGHTVLTQPDTGGTVRRFATIPVPVARAADPKMANPSFNSAQDSGRPPTPVFLSVAIPLEDVMTGKMGSGAGDKAPFAGSYGIAGEITFTTASIRRTE